MIWHTSTTYKNSEGTILISKMTSEKGVIIRNKDDFFSSNKSIYQENLVLNVYGPNSRNTIKYTEQKLAKL